MANLRAGLIGLGMMGRNHARVLRGLSGVDLVGVADPGGDPHKVAGSLDVLPDIESLIKVGIDYCMVASSHGVPRAGRRRARRRRRPPSSRSHSRRTLPRRSDWSTSSRVPGWSVGAVGHIERYNPALQGGPPPH